MTSINLNDLSAANDGLENKHPEEIIEWALSLNEKTVLTTNFGPHEAAIIFAVRQCEKNVPIIWVDSGYNTKTTYEIAHKLKNDWRLNLYIYTPRISSAYRNAILGGIPLLEDEDQHKIFTDEVKLEPFDRSLNEHKPKIWLTALRREQTPHRENLNIIVPERMSMLKISPFFSWKEKQIIEYMKKNNLPINTDYFDPTKVLGKRECGLHLYKQSTAN